MKPILIGKRASKTAPPNLGSPCFSSRSNKAPLFYPKQGAVSNQGTRNAEKRDAWTRGRAFYQSREPAFPYPFVCKERSCSKSAFAQRMTCREVGRDNVCGRLTNQSFKPYSLERLRRAKEKHDDFLLALANLKCCRQWNE
jgi:hypothetical protein